MLAKPARHGLAMATRPGRSYAAQPLPSVALPHLHPIAARGRRFYVAAANVKQLGPAWLANKTALSTTDEGNFLLKSAPDLFRATRLVGWKLGSYDTLACHCADAPQRPGCLRACRAPCMRRAPRILARKPSSAGQGSAQTEKRSTHARRAVHCLTAQTP